jgi:hypothetical protein
MLLSGYLSFVFQGDPYSNSVILWTRVSPVVESDKSNITVEGTVPLYSHETELYIKHSKRPICVEYRVSTDPDLHGQVVDSGRAYTTSDIDYTIKVCLQIPLLNNSCNLFNFEKTARSKPRIFILSVYTTTSLVFAKPTRKVLSDELKPYLLRMTTPRPLD